MKKSLVILFSIVVIISSIIMLLFFYPEDDIVELIDDKYPENKKKSPTIEYDKLTDILSQSNIEVPIYENLIPQGITVVDDYIFISVYDNFGLINSKVYVIDSDGNIVNIITLDTNSHVGAISYDKKNKLIWIPDNNGILNAYNVKDFYKKSHTFYKYQFTNLADDLIDFNDDTKNSIDYLTIVDDYLYIGSFSLIDKGLAKKYKINNNGNISLDFINSFSVPNKVQGLSFYNDYMFMSISYGRKKPSYLYVYKYDDTISSYNNDLVLSYKLPSMLEQISIYNNQIYLVFENTAKKYIDSIDKIGHVGLIDIEKIIDE